MGENGVSVIIYFNWSFVFVNPFFYIMLNFDDVIFVTIFTGNEIYACVENNVLVIFEKLVKCLMVWDVVCIIGIAILFNLSFG